LKIKNAGVQLGFKTSVIALFVAIVLVIGLTLVYLSFLRINLVTNAAASQFIGKVAELSVDRIGSQLKVVRDSLRTLNALPSVQSARPVKAFDPGTGGSALGASADCLTAPALRWNMSGASGERATDLPDELLLRKFVQPLRQKHFCFRQTQIRITTSASRSHKRSVSRSSRTSGKECDGRGGANKRGNNVREDDAAADGEIVVMVPEMAQSSFFALLCSKVARFHPIYLQDCLHCRRPK
jgi:hypothetical protein